MWRILHAFAIAALIGSAAYVYGVKYRTIYASEQLVKTRHLIDREKDAIGLLRAEFGCKTLCLFDLRLADRIQIDVAEAADSFQVDTADEARAEQRGLDLLHLLLLL